MSYYLAPRERSLRVCYVNYDNRIIDATLEQVERELDKIYEFEIVELDHLDAPEFDPCDLLVLIAHQTTSDHLLDWVKSLAVRLAKRIWTPTLIIGDLRPVATRDLVGFASSSNWYFDVVDSEHLSSMALRMANLIRIKDHLHELFRYESSLSVIERKADDQKKRVDELIKKLQQQIDR
ncbi:MAG: hypothetical protein OXC40_01910 [Proteobacteria bacterium]|nr:hypothetical protein [Pseudomonadota bacterium]